MEIRIRNGKAEISGYVNAVGRESRVLRDSSGSFIETVEPGTFEKSLSRGSPVGLMFNHVRMLDSTEGGLQLEEDAIGLKARATVEDEEIVTAAKENRLTGWSFGFSPLHDEWRTDESGMRHRTLTDIDLIEVSILTKTPAYIATSIECRGAESMLVEHRYSENETIETSVEEQEEIPEQEEQQKRTYNAYAALAKSI